LLLIVHSLFANSTIFLSDAEKHYLQKKRSITMCVDPDWEPFEVINKEGKHEGIAADLIQLIAKRLDVPIVLLPTKDWEESLAFSHAKKCDILSFLNTTKKRQEWLLFTEPLFRDKNIVVGRAESAYIDNLARKKLKVALPVGTSIGERFAQDFPNLEVIQTQTEAEAFQLIEDKKADITLRSLVVTAHTIKKEGLFNLKIIGEPKGYENELRIGVLKEETLLKEILNKAIANITQKDTQAILNNHVSIVIERGTINPIWFYLFAIGAVLSSLVVIWNTLLRKKVAQEVAKNYEKQKLLFQAQKKGEIGSLLGNISHQWRDGLTAINAINMHARAQLNMGIVISQEEMQKNTLEIEQSIRFMSQTMQSFLAFYKPSTDVQKFRVKKSIEETLDIVHLNLKQKNITLIIQEQYELEISAIENEWMNIWFNMFSNLLNIVTQKELQHASITFTIEQNSITVEDDCGGFDAQKLSKLQNKEFGGLGLKMSADIAQKYHWLMEIKNSAFGAQIEFIHKI